MVLIFIRRTWNNEVFHVRLQNHFFNTGMTRLYGRASSHERVVDYTPGEQPARDNTGGRKNCQFNGHHLYKILSIDNFRDHHAFKNPSINLIFRSFDNPL